VEAGWLNPVKANLTTETRRKARKTKPKTFETQRKGGSGGVGEIGTSLMSAINPGVVKLFLRHHASWL
jgi:hypothetical protein